MKIQCNLLFFKITDSILIKTIFKAKLIDYLKMEHSSRPNFRAGINELTRKQLIAKIYEIQQCIPSIFSNNLDKNILNKMTTETLRKIYGRSVFYR